MGVYYYYANLTKREMFSVGALGGGVKFGAPGRTLASRAFNLLLMTSGLPCQGEQVIPMGPGHWAADSIAIVGDDLLPDWEQFKLEFADIEADAIRLVFDADGFESLAEIADKDDGLFMQLCYLVATRQMPRLEPHLREHYGTHYLKRYKELCVNRSGFVAKDLLVRQ